MHKSGVKAHAHSSCQTVLTHLLTIPIRGEDNVLKPSGFGDKMKLLLAHTSLLSAETV